MHTSIKLIVCASIIQVTVACGAPLPEQCKQLEDIQKTPIQAQNPTPSKQFELFAEEYTQKSKNIEKLSISDSSLKAVQQRFVKNYDDLAKIQIALASNAKQLENLGDEPPPANQTERLNKMQQVGALSDQAIENINNSTINLKENTSIDSEMKKICAK